MHLGKGCAMNPFDDSVPNIFSRGDLQLMQTTLPILSLNEAWLRTLDRCVLDSPLSEVILPLMRNCFFGGAMHAVLLLQKGHGDELASDITDFFTDQPQS
jgi:hypothetical protein